MGLSSIGKAIGGSLGSGIGGGIAGGIIGNVFGGSAARQNRKASVRQQDAMFELATGKHGLTPQEFYGSGAAGGNTTTAPGQVLGNMAQEGARAGLQMRFQANENQKNRDNNIEVEKIRAGVSERGQDMTFQTALRDYNLRATQYFDTVLPQITANIQKTEAETQKVLNEVKTSNPEFVQMMKLLSMGPDNVYVAGVLEAAGISRVEQIGELPKEEQQKILASMLVGKSHLAKELAAFEGRTDDFFTSVIHSLVNQGIGIKDKLGSMFGNSGIEATSGPRKSATPKRGRRY